MATFCANYHEFVRTNFLQRRPIRRSYVVSQEPFLNRLCNTSLLVPRPVQPCMLDHSKYYDNYFIYSVKKQR